MLSEKAIDRINNVLKDRTFNYTGKLLHDIDCDIDFKIELLGYRNMISVGTEYPYMRVKIIFTKFKDDISKLIFGRLKKVKGDNVSNFMNTSLPMKYELRKYLSSVLSIFDNENHENVVIDDIEIRHNFEDDTTITEQKVPALAIRTVIRDIITVLKSGETDEVMLPYDLRGEETYQIMNFPEFDVFLDIRQVDFEEIPSGADYSITSSYVSEGQQLQILILYVPDRLNKSFSSMIANLNDDVAHELQHMRQDNEGRLDLNTYRGSKLGYFLQPDELEAQYYGFKRKSKSMRIPMTDLIDDWFENNAQRFKLSDKDVKTIKSAIMGYLKNRN